MIVFVCLVFLIGVFSFADGANVVFKTGFEKNVSLDPKISDYQEWSDDPNPSCAANPYCNGGFVDSVTGYNVPFDMPGRCFYIDCYTQSGGGAPYFQLVASGTDDAAEISASTFKTGSKSLRIYNDDVGDPASRTQLNIGSQNSGSGYHNFNDYTCTKFWVYWTQLPSLTTPQWNLWYEWMNGNLFPGRLMWISDASGGFRLQAFGGASAYSRALWKAQSGYLNRNDYLNKWIEVVVYFNRDRSNGRCIVEMKPEGGLSVTLINFTGDTDTGQGINTLMPIKNYGPGGNDAWTYYDDFAMYSSTGPTDLPGWDSTSFSCIGTIPANAIAYDSEESTDLTIDTPWTFSTNDTSTKCQYNCNLGYSWDGSACILQTQTDSYTILKTSTPPAIDGSLNEFTNANPITITDSYGTTGTYKFLWDSDALYFAADVSDSNLNADLSHQEDGALWDDDSLEMIFDTLHNKGAIQNDDYKFFVNVNDEQADSQRYDMSWDSGMTKSVLIKGTGTINNRTDTDTGYVIEARIPWSNWKTPKDSEVWGMNLALNDKSATGSRLSTVWSGSSVNNLDDSGVLAFSSQFVAQGGSICNTGADSNADGAITISELINYISQWKAGSVTIGNLIDAIGKWKGRC